MRIDLICAAIAGTLAATATFQSAGVQSGPSTGSYQNQPPQCLALSPGRVLCNGGLVTFVLDASASSDPENDPLTFRWSSGCPTHVIADPAAAITTMTVDTSVTCETTCSVRLTVNDGTRSSSCRTFVSFEPLEVSFGFAPGVCPNTIVIENDGTPGATAATLPTSLIGSKAFDPMTVDFSTLRLGRFGDNFLGGSVPPIGFEFVDVATPFEGDLCECNPLAGDGFTDLLVTFDLDQVIDQLGLAGEPNGSVVPLELTGLLLDGTLTVGVDCVVIEQVEVSFCDGSSGSEPLVLSTEVLFSQLDGSGVDLDGAADGSLEIDGGLVINGVGGILVDVPQAQIAVRGPVRMEFAGRIDTAEGPGFSVGPDICLRSCSTITMLDSSSIRSRGSIGGGNIVLCAEEEVLLDDIAGLDARPLQTTAVGASGGSIQVLTPGRIRVPSILAYFNVQARQAGEIALSACAAEPEALFFEGRLQAAGLGSSGVGGSIRLEARTGGMWLPTNAITATGALQTGTVDVFAGTVLEPGQAPMSNPPATVSEGVPSPEPCTCACAG